MKTMAIIQARMGSMRLPNKVMMKINNIPMIEIIFSRLNKAKNIDKLVLATSRSKINEELKTHVKSLGFDCFSGDENDVLDRFYKVSKLYKYDIIIRITGDCPLVDPEIVDTMIENFKSRKFDYYANTLPPTFPDGLDVEIFSAKILEEAWKKAFKRLHREHVTPFIYESNQYKLGNFKNFDDLSHLRLTVDEMEDYKVINNIFNYFKTDIYFSWKSVYDLYKKKPSLFKPNKHLSRNEGSVMTNGQKLWKRAKKAIPGGNMLLSKRPDMFLPGKWPTYFSKAKSCYVWDLDDRKYIDMSIMGIGTNTLGYGREEVDEAVRKTIEKGNMSTFNCPEEVFLAEKLIELHPWADMVKYARSGGEANSIAIRIARAASGKDNVAICGYHGWHDWYLAANLKDENSLDSHLLPGLETAGVPSGLKNTTYPFLYNDYKTLENLVLEKNIGTIKMEVFRNQEPQDNFLEKVRELATKNNIVLIFDECTSGFRKSFGGLHKHYKVEPDIAMFGKALGNGYAITSVLGREEIMDCAQSTFISSTFWTERIGPTAALKTLEIMKKESSWIKIDKIGIEIKKNWKKLSSKYNLPIKQWGLPALAGFSFESNKNISYKTLITQEMLKVGILASNAVYVCTEHSSAILDKYFFELDKVFSLIKECEEGRDIKSLLESEECSQGFRRLN